MIAIGDLSFTQKQQTAIAVDKNKKLVTLETSWTGTPTGSLSLEVSNSSPDGLFTSPGLWIPYSKVTISPQPSGAAGNIGIELIDFGWRWVRYSWTFTSGAGILFCVPYQV